MIAYRFRHPVIRKKLPDAVCGMRPICTHDIQAEKTDISHDARAFSISFAGYNKERGEDDLVYVSINSYWENVTITLPQLHNQVAWYLSVNTYGDGEGHYTYPEGQEVRIDHEFVMRPRSVAVFTGRSTKASNTLQHVNQYNE